MYRHWKHDFELPVSSISIILALAAGIITRVLWVCVNGIPFNADAAVFGLMGRHIAQGTSFPLFFLGQKYMSALPAYLLAPFYWLPIHSMAPLLIYSLIWSIVFLLVLVSITNTLFCKRVALYTAVLMIFPPYHLFIWLMGVHGYQMFLMVALIYIWCIARWLSNGGQQRQSWLRISAVVAGVGWYLHPMFIYCIISFVLLAGYHVVIEKKPAHAGQLFINGLLWCVLFLAGSLLYWIGQIFSSDTYNAVSSVPFMWDSLFNNARMLFTIYLPAVLSLDCGQVVLRYLSMSAYIGIFCYILYALGHWVLLWYRGQVYMGLMFVALFCSILAVFVCASPAQTVVDLRHLTPLITVWAVLIALCMNKIPVRRRWFRYLVITVILVHNIVSATDTFVKPASYKPLLKYLTDNNLKRGFAPYNLAYPVTYMSGESIILAPFGQVGRYRHYMIDAVDTPDTVYVFDTHDLSQKDMTEKFVKAIHYAGISYERKQVKNYTIFHGLEDKESRHADFFVPLDPSYIVHGLTEKTVELILPDGDYTVVMGNNESEVFSISVKGSPYILPLGADDSGYMYCVRQPTD